MSSPPALRVLLAASVVLGGSGCGDDATDSCSVPQAAVVPAPRPALRNVVETRIAELDQLLGEAVQETDQSDPDEVEHVEGLLSLVASTTDADMRAVGLEEAAGLGDAAVPVLASRLIAEDVGDDERAAALELLAAIDTPASAAVLLERLENAELTWVRAHAAWRLAATEQSWCVPALLRRLKYEKDHDTALWIARALAHFENYAGLGALRVVAETSPDARLSASALARAAEIAGEAGAEDAWSLAHAWEAGELEPRKHSPRYEREVWRWVARFSEFQLRGVDDARFVLERLDGTAAGWLGDALADTNVYVRVHTAQSLERMGPRAAPAIDDLVRALEDPDLAPGAAMALGAIGLPAGEAPVRNAAGPDSAPDLRLAALRALGGFAKDDPAKSDELTSFLRHVLGEAVPAEFHQAAAESLFELGVRDPELLERLASYLETSGIEPATTERVLEGWIASLEDTELLERWLELGRFDELVVPLEKRRAAWSQRAQLIRELARTTGEAAGEAAGEATGEATGG